MPLLDLLASWLVREDSVFVIPFALAAAVLVPFAVAQRRHRAMGLRVGFTLSIYTACYLIFLFLLHCSSSSTGGSSSLVPSLYRAISALHLCALLYHLAYGFTWNLRPWFIYGVGLPGYCFFLAVVLFVPGFVAVRLCSLAFALVFGRCAVAESIVAALPSPLADELVLVALFSLLFTWSILFHQAGLPALEVVDLDIDYARVHPTLCRLSVPHHRYGGDPAEVKPKTSTNVAKSFTVGQISDPHLGLFMSAAQLRSVCEEVVALRDLFSAEIQRGPYAGRQLKWALEPLASPDVRAFACLGNHDYEGLSLIQSALKSLGIRLLCDESETIIGTHYVFPERRKAEHLQKMCAKYPATITASASAEDLDEGDGGPQSDMVTTTRLMLVHDPKGFSFIDPNERVLAFAGHNHGGQVGLETFGIRWTLPRAVFPTFTDLGLWAKGRNYWYVHRGTGQHAFPFRWGVQRERSLLRVTISSSD